MTRIDRIGIANERLDLGDAQSARSDFRRRRGGRPLDGFYGLGLFERPPELEIACAAFARGLPCSIGCDRRDALEKPRGHRLDAVLLFGARDHDAERAHRLREVVRREADAPLRQVERQRLAHRSIEPCIRSRLRRPCAFVQCAEQHEIGVEQARFQRAEDADARAAVESGPHRRLARQQLREGVGIFGERQRGRFACGLVEPAEGLRERTQIGGLTD
jgi:hypothetical protein